MSASQRQRSPSAGLEPDTDDQASEPSNYDSPTGTSMDESGGEASPDERIDEVGEAIVPYNGPEPEHLPGYPKTSAAIRKVAFSLFDPCDKQDFHGKDLNYQLSGLSHVGVRSRAYQAALKWERLHGVKIANKPCWLCYRINQELDPSNPPFHCVIPVFANSDFQPSCLLCRVRHQPCNAEGSNLRTRPAVPSADRNLRSQEQRDAIRSRIQEDQENEALALLIEEAAEALDHARRLASRIPIEHRHLIEEAGVSDMVVGPIGCRSRGCGSLLPIRLVVRAGTLR